MTTSATMDLDRFRTAICWRTGLYFDDAKLGFLSELLQRRLDCSGQTSTAYLRSLEDGSGEGEIASLARELTVGETYFFRNIEQFRVLSEVVLPERLNARRGSGALRLLSAGCASGEEPYSLAIVARETFTHLYGDVSIRAVDLNPAFLEKARRARYSSWAFRDAPVDVRRKWFRPEGRELALDAALREAVQFEAGNLATDDPGLWQPGAYDVVFCRNVLMYFSPEQMRATIARIARSLASGGFLFLGHAETLRGISDEFHLRHSHGTFYYELKDSSERASSEPIRFVPSSTLSICPSASLDGTWIESIRNAAERVAKLVSAPEATMAARAPGILWDPAPALDLLRHERFTEALSHVRARPPENENDPDVLLLEATLLAHGGELVAAEDACLRLLIVDEFNAGAHYVLALCREHSGNVDRAIEHDRVATYLDPAFAMPRLHMGLLAGRAGDRETARRELLQAVDLLKREDASRLLLFGGGFGREALMGLCEAALKENGVRP